MKFVDEYGVHLKWVDSLTADVLKYAPEAGPVGDPFRADLAGLLSTSYVAALECCVKSVFISFANSKHKLLGNAMGFHFSKINSKIHWNTIADTYIGQFGSAYRTNFLRLLAIEEEAVMAEKRVSVKETYTNLLRWRHAFVHEGKKLTTLEEVTDSFPIAKRVIEVLDDAMSN